MSEKIKVGDLVHYRWGEPNEIGIVLAIGEKNPGNTNKLKDWCHIYWQDEGKAFGLPMDHLKKVKGKFVYVNFSTI